MGYRLPGAVLVAREPAARRAAPGVAPSRSVRADGDPPDLHRVDGRRARRAGRRRTRSRSSKEFATVAVIAMPASASPSCGAAIEARGVVLAEPGEVEPDRPIVVVPAPLAKGLEFDGVIVVEPAEIAALGTARRAAAVRRAHPRGAAPRDRLRRRPPARATARSAGPARRVTVVTTVEPGRRSAIRRRLRRR